MSYLELNSFKCYVSCLFCAHGPRGRILLFLFLVDYSCSLIGEFDGPSLGLCYGCDYDHSEASCGECVAFGLLRDF